MVDKGEGLRWLATWVARGAFACLVTLSSWAAMLAQSPAPIIAADNIPVPQQLCCGTPISPERENEMLHDRVVALGDRLSNIEGKLDVMEKLDIGLIIAMGGQLLHLALSKKKGGRE